MATAELTRRERYRQEVYRRYGLSSCPPRFATLRDVRRPTLGPKVARIMTRLGTPPLPWQRYCLDVGLEIDPQTGIFVYRKLGVLVPRQSGKTSEVLGLAVHRGKAWQRQRILYAAQSGTAAREKWEDEHVDALLASPYAAQVKIRKSNAREAIIWRSTRSIHGITTNTKKSGHGKTLHLGLADEYFAQVDYRLDAAWSPAMITVPSAQRWWFSTAGTTASVPLNAEIERGRLLVLTGAGTRTAYFDWSAPDGKDGTKRADYRDPEVWKAHMPALCPTPGPCTCSPYWRHTIGLDEVQAELEGLPLEEFCRAYMNWTTDENALDADPHVPTVEAWELLADEHSVGTADLALGIDAYEGWAAIVAVGGTPDGLRRLVVLEAGPGTAWVPERAAQLDEQLRPVAWAIDDKAAAGKLIEPLQQAGIERMGSEPHRGGLWVPTVHELSAATGRFGDIVDAGGLVHTGQLVMQQSLAVARTRTIGDGAFAFGRRVSSADITPLTAGTLALAAFERFEHLAYPSGAPNVW